MRKRDIGMGSNTNFSYENFERSLRRLISQAYVARNSAYVGKGSQRSAGRSDQRS
jgi:hypothetical protein